MKEWYLKHQPQIMTAMVVIFSLLAIAIIVLLVLSSYSKKKQEDHLRFKKENVTFLPFIWSNETLYF